MAAGRWEGSLLEAVAIISDAENQVHLTDRDKTARKNLEKLVDSLNHEAGLSEAGAAAARRMLTASAVNRLEGLKWLGDRPEITDEVIEAPLFLLGLPRSGGTYFQSRSDRDGRFRLVRSWECTTPNPPPGLDPAAAVKRKTEWLERYRRDPVAFDGFNALQPYNQDGWDECYAFLAQSSGAAGLHHLFHVPEYFDYLINKADLAETYRVHKRQLQLLQWQSARKPWILKYPSHVLAMHEILQVYPDARFVMTHRDPVQSLALTLKLTGDLRGRRTEKQIDPSVLGRDILHFIQRHIDRIMEFDDGPEGGRVIHIDYYALIDDPMTEMRRIHAWLGIETPSDTVEAADEWHRANPRSARERHDDTLAQWGLDDAEVAEQFGEYMSRFGIPREHDALAQLGG